MGDLLCRVLEAGGQAVTREYYFNDSGTQIDHLGASVAAVRRGEPVPEDGYKGAYVEDLAAAMSRPTSGPPPPPTARTTASVLGGWASRRVRAMIEASLTRLGVRFDVWKSEASLHDDGWVGRAVGRLRDAGHVYEQDGATWFRSTTFGDDKDRVIYRSDGRPTYFAADIGYVTEKFSRGFDHLIYIWGVDHHGTVARNKNAAQAMGYDPDHYQVLLIGWVRFVVDGVEVSMSKRAGTFVTLDDLLDAVGTDAARWFFASRAAHVEIDFDIELAKKQSAENPVYYVQYAHARIASILRKAEEAGLAPAPDVDGLLAGEPEAALARVVSRLPEVVEDAVLAEETQGITAYATELATQFHAFYRDARVVDEAEPERSAKRLALALATKTTLANALGAAGDLRARVDVGGPRPGRGEPVPAGRSAGEPEGRRHRAQRGVRVRRHQHHAVRGGLEERRALAGGLQLRDQRPERRGRIRRRLGRVPPRVDHHRRGAAGALEQRDAVTAPACRRVCPRVGVARPGQDPQLELPERVLERDRPAGAQPGREVGGERHRDWPSRATRACRRAAPARSCRAGSGTGRSTAPNPPLCCHAPRVRLRPAV